MHPALSTSLAQVEQRKKIDEDDYRVPIFIQPIPAEFISGQPELCAESRLSGNSRCTAPLGTNIAATAKGNSSDSDEALRLGDQNILHDLSYDSGSGEDGSCRSLHAENLERGDSVSETSILDTESALEITPDEVVGAIGQKRFWKARKAIMK